MATKKFVLLLLTLTVQNLSYSQISIPGQYADRIDKLRDSSALSVYHSIISDSDKGFSFISPLIKTTYNYGYPRGYNDGAVWKGNGTTIEIHGGVQGKKGKFSYTFFPVIFYSQNTNFNRGENAPAFKYQYSSRIDWVQQYGYGSFWRMHPGQSEVKFESGAFQAAISTQNYSIGPSNYNPIILSRQAGGFPHMRIGMLPKDIFNIGKVEANVILGILDESEYYDDIEENNKRYINILALTYSPTFLPNLKLGFNKSLYKQTRYFETTDLFSSFFIIDNGVINGDTLSPNDTSDQLASLTIDWNFKEIGFRAYAEFAKNDFTSDGAGIRPTLIEPEHTRAYTLGFEKELTTKKGRVVRFGYEHTNLSKNSAFLWRPTPSYYSHGINRNGYTNNGQIIGSGIGPGGNSDHFEVSVDYEKFKVGLLIQRIEHNRDYFVTSIQNSNLHDQEYTGNGYFSKEFKSMILFAEASFSKNYNKYYEKDTLNFSASLGVQLKMN